MRNGLGAIVLLAFVLVGCSTVGEQAVGTLCTGTKKPYKVMGCWYSPQDHYDYEEEGVASWYGPRFHGRPKSCGEIFNMHGISAAHKTLPIPSVVEVTNVRTGTSVKLLVDDRGPFVDNRIIDLSKGAASYLGIHDRGLGTVRVKCLPEESKAFAKFVAQYGRYGRDPNGRTWETIFREHFERDCISAPKSIKSLHHRQPHKHPRVRPKRDFEPFRRAGAKSSPVFRRNQPESDIDREIEALLDDTEGHLRHKQV